jgi:hypothetical protein
MGDVNGAVDLVHAIRATLPPASSASHRNANSGTDRSPQSRRFEDRATEIQPSRSALRPSAVTLVLSCAACGSALESRLTFRAADLDQARFAS